MTAETAAPPLLDQIIAQREKLVTLRLQHARDEAVEVRRLAELLDQARRPESGVSLRQAAKAMGTSAGWPHALVKRLDDGDLDAP